MKYPTPRSALLLSAAVLSIAFYHFAAHAAPTSVSSDASIHELLQLNEHNLQQRKLRFNEAAYLPPQCYTQTLNQRDGKPTASSNPCYACHTGPNKPNYLNDADLQLSYQFRPYTASNHWLNLFRDFSAQVNAQTDEDIANYISQSNYFSDDGKLVLAEQLKQLPKAWDSNQNGQWDGYTPDLYFNFNEQGFDLQPDGQPSGWRAFAYYPFLGTFFPTNGSTDDVFIRLPSAFYHNAQGQLDLTAYQLNLAIIESLIKQQSVTINATDENEWQVDLNQNGKLDTATEIVFQWPKRQGRAMNYVGQAKSLLAQGLLQLAAGLYPVGTEFLHSVRYLQPNAQSGVALSARMKELRYSQKRSWNSYAQLHNVAMTEVKETHDFPERLRNFAGDPEIGLSNGLGWVYQGFIEDKRGQLRPQNFEEANYCIGCHSGVSATADSSFAFARKFDHRQPQQGWYHWSQSTTGFKGIQDGQRFDGQPDYQSYLLAVGGGDEFRQNQEVRAKFFNADGSANTTALTALQHDISTLLVPSAERAMTLNKAYRAIVQEQSYVLGRDAHVTPLANVHQQVSIGQATAVTPIMRVAPVTVLARKED